MHPALAPPKTVAKCPFALRHGRRLRVRGKVAGAHGSRRAALGRELLEESSWFAPLAMAPPAGIASPNCLAKLPHTSTQPQAVDTCLAPHAHDDVRK